MRPSGPLLLLLVLGLAACGGGPVRDTRPSGSTAVTTAEDSTSGDSTDAEATSGESAGDDGEVDDSRSPPPAPTCPATFAAAQGGCVAGPGTEDCDYPEGVCYCGEPRVCSGAMRPPMPPEAYSWQCTPVPPEVRADGCPGSPPNEGVPCSLDHSCGYGFCGGPTYDCVEGEWHMTGFTGPRP